MPLPRKPQYERNPLRVLRELLSPRGKKHPISQQKLSELIDVPVPTIRGIEAGQRPLTLFMRERVLYGTGAQWDEDRERWLCGFELNEEAWEWVWSEKSKPFSYAAFSRFYQSRSVRPSDEIEQEVAIISRLTRLFLLLPDDKWWSLALRFHQFIRECWDHYDGDELEREYNKPSEAKTPQEFLAAYQARLRERARERKKEKRSVR